MFSFDAMFGACVVSYFAGYLVSGAILFCMFKPRRD